MRRLLGWTAALAVLVGTTWAADSGLVNTTMPASAPAATVKQGVRGRVTKLTGDFMPKAVPAGQGVAPLNGGGNQIQIKKQPKEAVPAGNAPLPLLVQPVPPAGPPATAPAPAAEGLKPATPEPVKATIKIDANGNHEQIIIVPNGAGIAGVGVVVGGGGGVGMAGGGMLGGGQAGGGAAGEGTAKVAGLSVPVHVFKGSMSPYKGQAKEQKEWVATVKADAQGYFEVALEPGEYTVVAEIDGKPYLNVMVFDSAAGRASWPTLRVEKDKVTTWNIEDTTGAAF
ncbi:MAG: hypothetical protein WCI73_04795 [Phycisphaerae bacterium]